MATTTMMTTLLSLDKWSSLQTHKPPATRKSKYVFSLSLPHSICLPIKRLTDFNHRDRTSVTRRRLRARKKGTERERKMVNRIFAWSWMNRSVESAYLHLDGKDSVEGDGRERARTRNGMKINTNSGCFCPFFLWKKRRRDYSTIRLTSTRLETRRIVIRYFSLL